MKKLSLLALLFCIYTVNAKNLEQFSKLIHKKKKEVKEHVVDFRFVDWKRKGDLVYEIEDLQQETSLSCLKFKLDTVGEPSKVINLIKNDTTFSSDPRYFSRAFKRHDSNVFLYQYDKQKMTSFICMENIVHCYYCHFDSKKNQYLFFEFDNLPTQEPNILGYAIVIILLMLGIAAVFTNIFFKDKKIVSNTN